MIFLAQKTKVKNRLIELYQNLKCLHTKEHAYRNENQSMRWKYFQFTYVIRKSSMYKALQFNIKRSNLFKKCEKNLIDIYISKKM